MLQGRPEIFVFFGLIATGKTTLAKAWAKRYQLRSFHSDEIRKELAGGRVSGSRVTPFREGIYAPSFSRLTYQALRERAAGEIGQGRAVVLDGSFHRREERDAVRGLARNSRADLVFILCIASEAELQSRMTIRSHDPAAGSDGRWEIYLCQKEVFEPPAKDETDVVTIMTDRPLAELLQSLAAIVADRLKQ